MIKHTFYFINRYKVLALCDAFPLANSFNLIILICYLIQPLSLKLSLLASKIEKASSLEFYRCITIYYSYEAMLPL